MFFYRRIHGDSFITVLMWACIVCVRSIHAVSWLFSMRREFELSYLSALNILRVHTQKTNKLFDLPDFSAILSRRRSDPDNISEKEKQWNRWMIEPSAEGWRYKHKLKWQTERRKSRRNPVYREIKITEGGLREKTGVYNFFSSRVTH